MDSNAEPSSGSAGLPSDGREDDSKKQILKSTGIVGSAQIITILIRIVRTKIIAVLLGPSGVGLSGLYLSTVDIVRGATNLGLDFSAVRDVAEANATGDSATISRIITVLRRWMWITGLAGLAVLAVFCGQFSRYVFKDDAHALDFFMLAAVPFLSAISSGQLVLLRGVRRIGDMAKANVLGAVAGFCVTIPLYWAFGAKGIVPAMVLAAAADLGLSWFFSRRLKIPSAKLSLRETFVGGAQMIRIGFFTVISGLAMSGALYLVRIVIVNATGLDSLGQFQAAWNLSATYVGLVLGSMGADYYPRLVTAKDDNARIRKMVDEQTEISLLLAGPLIIGMLGFVDIVIRIFYTSKFGVCADILLWQLGGELFKIIAWPMGFVLLAKGKGLMYILADIAWDALLLGLVWLFIGRIGIPITGIAFFIGYIVYAGIAFILCRRTCGFIWSWRTIKSILFFLVLSILAFLNMKFRYFPFWRIASAVFLLGACAYSFLELRKIIDLKTYVEKLARKLGIARKGGKTGD
jgi:O-antigen/teichoic acid export membrane protein